MRVVIPTDRKDVTPEDVAKQEEQLQKTHNKPFQVIVIQPEVIKQAEYTWEITISQREKKTSDAAKVMFRGMMQDIEVFGQDINMQYLEEEFAIAWGKDPSKLFKAQQQQPQQDPSGRRLEHGHGCKAEREARFTIAEIQSRTNRSPACPRPTKEWLRPSPIPSHEDSRHSIRNRQAR